MQELCSRSVEAKEAGWVTIAAPEAIEGTRCVMVELANYKGKETVRVRGIKVLGAPEAPLDERPQSPPGSPAPASSGGTAEERGNDSERKLISEEVWRA